MTAKIIRVYLQQDPTVCVTVKTTEDRVRSKLRGIRRDIWGQKFPRWEPFKDQPEGNKHDNTPGWVWEFVE